MPVNENTPLNKIGITLSEDEVNCIKKCLEMPVKWKCEELFEDIHKLYQDHKIFVDVVNILKTQLTFTNPFNRRGKINKLPIYFVKLLCRGGLCDDLFGLDNDCITILVLLNRRICAQIKQLQ